MLVADPVKLRDLKRRIKKLRGAVLAYSGGVDSSFLLKVSKEVLGDNLLAVIAVSETYSSSELKQAVKLAQGINARYKIIRTSELKNPLFKNNPFNRCYYCKKELFARLKKIAAEEKINFVIDGSNFDDLKDYRPGALAKEEFGIISPLQEAELSKKEIRRLSKKLKLDTWSKPAQACLASRIPYHTKISKSRLVRIDKAEKSIRKNFSIKGNLRARDYADFVSIEADKKEIKKLKPIEKVKLLLLTFGYKKVIIDKKGYRCGSLNEKIRENKEKSNCCHERRRGFLSSRIFA